MSYIPAKASKTVPPSEDELIVDLIMRNMTATQFIEKFNDSEEIDFLAYTHEIVRPYAKEYGGFYYAVKIRAIQEVLFSRVLHMLLVVASEKVQKFLKTEAAWEFFAETYMKSVNAPFYSAPLKALRTQYILASREDYFTFEAKYEEVLAMSESLGLSSTYDSVKIARLAYDMHTNQANPVEQIELPAIEF